MTALDLLLGWPLASDEGRGEQIGSLVGVPVYGLDALSSAAYGPEAALTLLIRIRVEKEHRLCPAHHLHSFWQDQSRAPDRHHD
jgi:hypothetical protein